MEIKFNDRVAVITGAAGGIGITPASPPNGHQPSKVFPLLTIQVIPLVP